MFDGYCDLSKADLQSANLQGVNLRWVNLSGANLEMADLRNADLRAELGRYGHRGPLTKSKMTHLHDATLRASNLRGADLSGAYLERADLRGAELFATNLMLTDLSEADLRGADFSGANLSMAKLNKANLSDAKLGSTTFGDSSLANVKGLESCQHLAPSHLDYYTLAKSGTLPIAFLRGCGLSDAFIDYLPSLIQQAIQFYSCFISYSTEDQEFADRLHADLQNRGVRCWFAPHQMKGGQKLHEQIDEAIRMYDRLLLILSEHSMASRWVKTEIAQARQKELTEQRRVLFPIGLTTFDKIQRWKLFDSDLGDDSARELREYFIPDFSLWKDHDSYQQMFKRLLADLKAENPK